MSNNKSLIREIYDAFQRGEIDRWDAVISPDVITTSPVGYGEIHGLEPLKGWAKEFIKALAPRIDLVDEHDGGGRAFIAVCMNWKHVQPFFGIAPTGREGTSIETFTFTIENGKVTRWYVAPRTLDLALYLWQRGMPVEHNAHSTPIIKGVERR